MLAWSRLRYWSVALLTSCARGDTICPRPSPPRVGAVASRAAEPTTVPVDGNVRFATLNTVRSHADRCSCLCVNR